MILLQLAKFGKEWTYKPLRINNLLSVYFDIFTHYTGADICEFFYIEGILRASPESLRNGQTARTSQNSLTLSANHD